MRLRRYYSWTAGGGGSSYVPTPHGCRPVGRRRQPRPPGDLQQVRATREGGGGGGGRTRWRRLQNAKATSFTRIPANPVSVAAASVGFLILLASVGSFPAVPSSSAAHNTSALHPREQLARMRRVRAHLRRLNKPAVRTIQSPDGDLIDCVPAHLQPAFDHPMLRGQMPLPAEPPERPTRRGRLPPPEPASGRVSFQLSWGMGGESCPEGTVPIRRTTEADILRASSVGRFGRKPLSTTSVRRDSTGSSHEHAVGYVMGYNGECFYGAKASLNVWSPMVSGSSEFSLSQMWLLAGSFAGDDLNTLEAGWQVSPELYGDSSPRFFTYWTADAYRATGCYNLLCSGFVQTSNKMAIGAAISPISSYGGAQFDIAILVWKDPKHGNWWLELGSGQLVGYWPSALFTHLAKQAASMVQLGGEVVKDGAAATQMGSGHFAGEGFGRASYFRDVQVVDRDNNLVPPVGLRVLADHPDCYDIHGGVNAVWGTYFYYGGPGRRSTGCFSGR